jgi:hypothetical protein
MIVDVTDIPPTAVQETHIFCLYGRAKLLTSAVEMK